MLSQLYNHQSFQCVSTNLFTNQLFHVGSKLKNHVEERVL